VARVIRFFPKVLTPFLFFLFRNLGGFVPNTLPFPTSLPFLSDGGLLGVT